MHEALGNETGVVLNVHAMQWPDWQAAIKKVTPEVRDGDNHQLSDCVIGGGFYEHLVACSFGQDERAERQEGQQHNAIRT